MTCHLHLSMPTKWPVSSTYAAGSIDADWRGAHCGQCNSALVCGWTDQVSRPGWGIWASDEEVVATGRFRSGPEIGFVKASILIAKLRVSAQQLEHLRMLTGLRLPLLVH